MNARAGTLFTLVLMASAAHAAPVGFGVQNLDPDGYSANLFNGLPVSFQDVHLFSLSQAATLSGSLMTYNLDDVPGLLPDLDVQSAYIQSVLGGSIYTLTQTLGITPGHAGPETWTLDEINLGAGDWKLVVAGLARNNKGADGYTGEFAGQTVDLPEPAAPALLAAALIALAWTRRSASVVRRGR